MAAWCGCDLGTGGSGSVACLGAFSRVARYRYLGSVGNAALGESYLFAILGGEAVVLLNPQSIADPQLCNTFHAPRLGLV